MRDTSVVETSILFLTSTLHGGKVAIAYRRTVIIAAYTPIGLLPQPMAGQPLIRRIHAFDEKLAPTESKVVTHMYSSAGAMQQ